MGNCLKFKLYINIDDVESYLGDAAACTLKPARPEVWAILCYSKNAIKFQECSTQTKLPRDCDVCMLNPFSPQNFWRALPGPLVMTAHSQGW